MYYSEDSGRVVSDNKVQGVVLEGWLEDVLGQKVFSHGVQELKAGGATFVGTAAAFMVPIDVGVVEVTSHEETLRRG